MASSLTRSKGCLHQPTATFLHKCDQKYSASAQMVLVAVGAGEWPSLENADQEMVARRSWTMSIHPVSSIHTDEHKQPGRSAKGSGQLRRGGRDVFKLRLLWASLNAFPCSQWTSPASILGIEPEVYRSFYAVIRR